MRGPVSRPGAVLRWGDGSPTCSRAQRIAATRLPSCLAPPPKTPQLPSVFFVFFFLTVALGALHLCTAERRGGGDKLITRRNKRLLLVLELFFQDE